MGRFVLAFNFHIVYGPYSNLPFELTALNVDKMTFKLTLFENLNFLAESATTVYFSRRHSVAASETIFGSKCYDREI